MRTFGAGNCPTADWFFAAIREAIEKGTVIISVTQCVNGGVAAKRYVSSGALESIGVISGHDITSEAAITKLMYLFGLGLGPDEVKQYLSRPLAGEMTVENRVLIQ